MSYSIYHICTGEDHPSVFLDRADYMGATNILALVVALHSSIKMLAFELMSNHVHLLVTGSKEDAEDFFKDFVKSLNRLFKAEGKERDFSRFKASYHEVSEQSYIRNVIVYINKNGSAASPEYTPYNYEWGTGRFFFNPEARARYNACKVPLSQVQRQLFSHSRKFDNIRNLYCIDGYISPLSFCDIQRAENMFQSPRQYLYFLVKNVELTREIAKSIGEYMNFTDNDLATVLQRLSSQMYGTHEYYLLGAEQKTQLAKTLHFDYNASNKQICRLLKIDISVLNQLFGR